MKKITPVFLLLLSLQAFCQDNPTELANPIVAEGKRLYQSEMAKLAIIIISPSAAGYSYDGLPSYKQSCKSITFVNQTDTLLIKEGEYKIILNKERYEIKVMDEIKLEKIKALKGVLINFCVNNRGYSAKGNFVLSSRVPDNADYIFPIKKDSSVVFMHSNTIILEKIESAFK